MSSGEGFSLTAADRYAAELLDLLRESCEELVVAGSVRRRRPVVHDLELVAVPKLVPVPVPSLFDDVDPILEDALARRLRELRDEGTLTPWTDSRGSPCWGPQHVHAWYHPPIESPEPVEAIELDLYAGPREEHAIRLFLRTGPAGYSQAHVTPKGKLAHVRGGGGVADHWRPGQLPLGLTIAHCRLFGGDGKPIPTPTEAIFYREIKAPYAEPWARH